MPCPLRFVLVAVSSIVAIFALLSTRWKQLVEEKEGRPTPSKVPNK
jgi:hypothetical protein